jgi:hypothetical protein
VAFSEGTVIVSFPLKGVYNPKAFILHAASLDQAFAHCPKFPTAASRRSLDRVSVPVWPIALSGRLPVIALVSRYLTNKLIGRGTIPKWIAPLTPFRCRNVVLWGISPDFSGVFPILGQVSHALLTRLPLTSTMRCRNSFDLHVLSTPPAFTLSQDQTLHKLIIEICLLALYFRFAPILNCIGP